MNSWMKLSQWHHNVFSMDYPQIFGLRPESDTSPHPLLEWTLHPFTPITFASIYLVVVSYYNTRRPCKPTVQIPRNLIVIHNAILAIYSFATFCKTAPLVYGSFLKSFWHHGSSGFVRTYCDLDNSIWLQGGLNNWSYVFYLSKYWEVLDTVIILVKGKKAAVLQEYHHAGAILTMWAALRFSAFPVWIFCVFNSFIHSVMYTYYALSTLKVNVPVALKRSLTTMQITQFLIGFATAASYLFIRIPVPDVTEVTQCLVNDGQRLATLLNLAYLTPLTVLFSNFFIKSYTKRGRRHAQGKQVKLD